MEITNKTGINAVIYDDETFLGNEAWKELEEEYRETHEVKEDEEVSERDLYEYMNFCLEMNFEDEMSTIEFYEKEHGQKKYLIIGNLGLWHGAVPVASVEIGLKTVIQKCCEDSNKIYYENGIFKIKASHHDGTNIYSIREITKEGEEYMESEDFIENYHFGLYQEIFNSDVYSKPVTLFIEVYGLS